VIDPPSLKSTIEGKGAIMKPRINMITLGVQDLERAISFYEKGLGLPRKPFEGNVAFFKLKG
jgi:predicted enzyme related to lactoylglutathione lyase